MMDNSKLVFTDSGGIQEQVFSMVCQHLSYNTERSEDWINPLGTAKFVGPERIKIDERASIFIKKKIHK
jgi:UDP-N-acetylglucosamine 2-epimerase